jgi:hypothetical protein
LARIEGEFVAAQEADLDLREIVQALGGRESPVTGDRCQTLATILSGSVGWKAAALALGGAFAEGNVEAALTGGKER